MNLYDIVKRNDRSLEIVQGGIEAVRRDRPDWFYGVVMQRGAHLRLKRADEFTIMATFPRDLGWRQSGPKMGPVEVLLRRHDGTRSTVLATSAGSDPILLTWPHWAGTAPNYDLDVVNVGGSEAEIRSGAVFDPRLALRDLLKGQGVEVGPGSNPLVKPASDIDIRYVETMSADEWLRTYGRSREPSDDERTLWSRYIIGDAQQLDCCDDGSLDFIFSNHVFEHLMNPLGVLENWSRKLRPGGRAVGVVPDQRYCFDLRQPPSRARDWLQEYDRKIWSLTQEKYEKWCKFTAPYNTPESLSARKYSIHAHYYTPATFRELADVAISRGTFSNVFINTSPNNKDFGWVLWRA